MGHRSSLSHRAGLCRPGRAASAGCVLVLKAEDEQMPLLLTQDDLRPLIEGPMFFTDLFQVIRDALLRQQSGSLGHLSWLAFPLGEEGRRFNINALATPNYGTSIRVFPVSGGDIHPPQNGFFALLIDNREGQLQALIATDDLSPLRTSAPVGLASTYLARPGSTTLEIGRASCRERV